MRVDKSIRVLGWAVCIAVAGAIGSWGTLANAQNVSPPAEQVIKDRIANFRKIGKAFKRIRDELRAQDPSAPVVQESAAQIASLGSQIVSWFPAGTDEGKTHAATAVWTKRPTFEQAQKSFYAEAQKMCQVAQTGDKSKLAAQYRALGKACKNCHESFRGKVEDDL